MRKRVEAGANGSRFTARDLDPEMPGTPLASAVIARVMSVVDRRAKPRRWSARRTLAFIIVSSLLLWTLIVSGVLWLARAFHMAG